MHTFVQIEVCRLPLAVEDSPLAHCTKFASAARMLTSSVRHNAMNYLLCLYGGAHAEPWCLCHGCVKAGMISWVAVANCVTASYPRTPQKGVLASGVVLASTVAAGFRSLFDKGPSSGDILAATMP
ncbi:hypothetical protein LB504_004177 [Fusarium proliferatum]|nr:hypothetical protein LB504_004177 [Fusarium proliferatum]